MLKSLIFLCALGVTLAGRGDYLPQNGPRVGSASFQHPVAATSHHPVAAPVQEHFEKQFYYFSAPEEKAAASQIVKKVVQAPVAKKHLQVVFIKAPEDKAYQQAASNLAQAVQQTEEKTHIYVLQKEPNIAALAKRVQQVQHVTHTHKPEVHFVKYHSGADANRAQQSIIDQYEKLGGKSTFFNGGHIGAASAPSRQYVPPVGASSHVSPAVADVPVSGNAYIPPGFY